MSMIHQRHQLVNAAKKQRQHSQLQLEQEKAEAQRHQSKKRAAARSPYKPHHRLLLIGEGNFSFAHALISSPPTRAFTPIPADHITATCYDSFDAVNDKYPVSIMHCFLSLPACLFTSLPAADCFLFCRCVHRMLNSTSMH